MRVLFIAVLSIGVLAGCSGDNPFPPTQPVTGKVTYKGKAVESAIVKFVMEGSTENAIGSTDKDGNYKLSTYSPGDGAPEGTYNISVSKSNAPPVDMSKAPQQGVIQSGDITDSYAPPKATDKGKDDANKKSSIPDKYASESTSGFRAVIKKGKNEVNLEME